MIVRRFGKQLSPLCFLPDGRLICYKKGSIISVKNDTIIEKHLLFDSFKEKLGGCFNSIYRLLRLGIRAAVALDNETLILSIKHSVYEYDLKDRQLSDGFYMGPGIRPLSFSSIHRIAGFEDSIVFGGYLSNHLKDPVHIYKRIGKDSWAVVYTFESGLINHIHNIIPDPFRNCVWIFTGDFDDSAAIWKATDGFKKVERVACNDQKYRGCVVYALPEGLLYATDAPFQDDCIYLMDTDTYEVKEIFPIHGSCIYGCQWKDRYVFSSTVEGDGRNMSRWEFYFGRKRGAGIKDNYVHMYMGNLQEGFTEIYKEKKDSMPYYPFQFGVFKFPSGENKGDTLYFQPVATKKNDLFLLTIML